MACPNKNTPEWRVLEDALGVFGAYKVFIANGYEIPSMTQVTEFLDAINPIYDLEYNQLSPSDVQIYQDQLEGYTEKYGVPVPKEMKEAVQKLLMLQGEIIKDDTGYKTAKTNKALERTTSYLESQNDGYYKFEGDEALYDNNREWGNQVDFILSEVIKGSTLEQTKAALVDYITKSGKSILLTEDVANKTFEIMTKFRDKFPGSVILTQMTFFNEKVGLAGTADIVVVNPDGSLRIFDLKSSVNPTNYDPSSGRFMPYKKGTFDNQYDRPFKKSDGTKRSSKKERHAAQLSIYKGLATSQGFTFALDEELGIVPIQITNTSDSVVTDLKEEPMFYLDSSREFLEKVLPAEDTSEEVEIYTYTNYDKLLDKVKKVLEARIMYLERKGPNRAEKYLISQLKEKINTTEKTKVITSFVKDIHSLFVGTTKYPGAVQQLSRFIQDINDRKITDPSEIITKMMTSKETIEMFRPIIAEIQGFIYGEVGVADAKPGSPLDMCNKIIGAFNRIDLLYKENINSVIASELTKSVSAKANTAFLKELKENEAIMARLNPESAAYKAREKRVNELKRDIGEEGVTFNTLLHALENGSNRDIPFQDYLLTPIISSSNPILALFGKTLKKAFENARQISLITANQASLAFKEYASKSTASKDNVAAFNKPFYTRVKVYDRGSKSMVDKMAFIQEIDREAYNIAESKMWEQAGNITDPGAKNKFIESWYAQNTEALPFEDKVITNPKTGEKVVIQKGRKTLIEEKKELVDRKIITEREFDYWLKNNQVEINGKMYYSRDFSVPSKSKYGDPRYNSIQSNPAQKSYYDYLISTYFKAQQRTPEGTRRGYILPSIGKTSIDRLVENGAVNYAKDSWRNLVKFTEKDIQQFGENVEGMKVIPVLYTNNMPADDVSLDLISSILLFDQASLKFQASNEAAALGEAALQSVKEAPPLKTDVLGGRIISEAAKKAGITNWEQYVKKNDGNNVAALLSAFIDMQIYGITMIDSKVGILGKTVDLNKLANNLIAVGSFTQIGGNPIGSAANYLQANAQVMIEAAAGDYFNAAEIAWAKLTYDRNVGNYVKDFAEPVNKSFIGQLIDLWDPMQGEYLDKYGRKISQSTFKKLWSTDTWFFLQNQGEHAIQVQTLLAMLKRNKVKRTVNGKTEEISMYDAYELGKDGVIKLKDGVQLEGNLSDNKLIDMDIQNSLHAINKRLHGVYNNQDRVVAERHWYGRLLLMYKKFFVPGLKRRFKAFGIDQELGNITEGYYGTFFRIARTQTMDMLKELSPFSSSDNLTDLEKKNLLRASRDMGMMMATGLIVMLLASMYEGGDDEDKKLLAYPLLFSMRLNQELSGFINPLANYKLIKNPMASQSVIEKVIRLGGQIFDPFETYDRRTGAWEKGDYKIIARILKLFGLNKNTFTPEEIIKAMEMKF